MGLHVGDVGAIIRLTSSTDISSQTSLKVKYERPDGVKGEWTGAINGTTNVQYTTTTKADLPVAGEWSFWPYAELSSGWKGHGKKVVKEVLTSP